MKSILLLVLLAGGCGGLGSLLNPDSGSPGSGGSGTVKFSNYTAGDGLPPGTSQPHDFTVQVAAFSGLKNPNGVVDHFTFQVSETTDNSGEGLLGSITATQIEVKD